MEEANGSNSSSMSNKDTYSIPQESKKLFTEDKPSIPINWRFAESISSLKALEATVVNILLKRKYGVEPQKVIINTDHAQLFFMSAFLWKLDPEGEASELGKMGPLVKKHFPSTDIHGSQAGFHRQSATNIYQTKDKRYFHIHGSMNPDPTLTSLNLPLQLPVSSVSESWNSYIDAIAQINASDLQTLESDVYKQAGTICYSNSEYLSSAHGKANAHVGLYEIRAVPLASQKPCWWPETPQTSSRRPLAGLKVVDLTRVIAAPTVSRGLAELGASVMRVTAPHLADLSTFHLDLNWGKWNCHLDFRKEVDCEKLRDLVREADIVVMGYRPGVLDKYGFDVDSLLKICEKRERGLVVVRENCYGWNGPWAYRSGWQQISDANCGVSLEFGRAMGLDEPVTPVFPNSDYCTGVVGTVAVLDALLRRAEFGGSYRVDIALNYYSQWLVRSCGMYPPFVWNELWSRYGNPVFRHWHNMNFTIPVYFRMLREKASDTLFREEFFEVRRCGLVGKGVWCVKPVAKFAGDEEQVLLGFDVGTRGNGVDAARWPVNLMTEIVP